jgi:hypothetical protein
MRWLWICLLALGCNTSGVAKATSAIRDSNAHARFGRMIVAAEMVKPEERDKFLERRLLWGSNVQIADSEVLGMTMPTKEEAVAFVRVSWYRLEDGELRQTTIKQRWREVKEDWLLVAEERAGGDIGLLGEHVEVLAPREPRANVQFPSVRIGSD